MMKSEREKLRKNKLEKMHKAMIFADFEDIWRVFGGNPSLANFHSKTKKKQGKTKEKTRAPKELQNPI